eukprot:779640_1
MSLSSVRNESMESNTSNTRKRKRSIESSTDDSLLPSPPRKRPQYDMNSNKSNPSQSALTSPSKYNRFDIDHEADMHSHKPSDDIKREDEEKQFEMDKLEISPKQKQTEEDKEKERLIHDGEYSLALPIIDCNRHKFDPQRTVNIIANALKKFMSIHRHPKLRIIVIATTEYRDTLHRALKTQYEMSVSLEDSLEFAEDVNTIKYEAFECDERIILYSGAWDEIVQLRDNGLCCQYLTNFTFWNYSGQKGDKLNKLINSKCDSLSALSIAKYGTAKKKCHCYLVGINEDNGGDLYKTQNIRCVLQTRPPSMNTKSHDYVKNEERAYSDLYDTYYRIMETFYQLTELTKPLDDSFIAKDVANWTNTCHEEDDDDHVLHFSLQSVPLYRIPNVHEWPKHDGYWKNALDVYVQKERDAKYNKCVFYEDDKFVVIYDRYWKAKIHLLIIPRVKVTSVYDLDPMNADHIEMIEGMIARAEWIKSGILKRNTEIHQIKYGFHAIPSMNQIHCHLISDDMDSVNMKQKKHFHSFTSNYFVPAKVMLKVLKVEHKKFKINKTYYSNLLKQNLKCHFCFNDRIIKTMPALKKHILQCANKKRNKNVDTQDDFEIVFQA